MYIRGTRRRYQLSGDTVLWISPPVRRTCSCVETEAFLRDVDAEREVEELVGESALRRSAPAVRISRLDLAFRTNTRLSRQHPPTENKAMFRKRRPTNLGASGTNPDPGRCEWVQHLAFGQLFDDSAASKEAEGCRWREDTPRYCERVLGLVWSPQVRPRWRERAHQTLRGICQVNTSGKTSATRRC
jgi:hypothetical protein